MLKFKTNKIEAICIVTACVLVWLSVPAATAAASASMYLSPSSKSVSVGDTLTVDLIEDSGSEPVNVAATTIYYPSDKLTFVSYSNSGAFSGASLDASNPGTLNNAYAYKTSSGLTGKQTVMTIKFTVSGTGNISINLEANLDTGKNPYSADISSNSHTNILTAVSGAAYTPAPDPSQTGANSTTSSQNNAPNSNSQTPTVTLAVPNSSSNTIKLNATSNINQPAVQADTNVKKASNLRYIIFSGLAAAALIERSLNYRKKIIRRRRFGGGRQPETIERISARINGHDRSNETVAELAARLKHPLHKQQTVAELAARMRQPHHNQQTVAELAVSLRRQKHSHRSHRS